MCTIATVSSFCGTLRKRKQVRHFSHHNSTSFFIVGHPGDNPVEAERTRAFIDDLFRRRLTRWVDLSTFTPYPGTPFFSFPERNGVRILTMDWNRWRRKNHPVCELDEFPASAITLAYLETLQTARSWT